MEEAFLEIPEELRSAAWTIEIGSDAGLAWDGDTAVRVIESLAGTKVAVDEVVVYEVESWGPTETEESWQSTRLPGQTATEHAEVSRNAAAAFIGEHEGGDGTLYLMWFDDQHDAA